MLDSSFVIDHMLGRRPALERWDAIFANGDEPIVSEVVLCEVRTGLRPVDEELLVTLLRPVEFVQPGPDAAVRAGRWRWEAARRGRVLSLADSLIAAAAEAAQAAVVTRNVRDFALTPVSVETY